MDLSPLWSPEGPPQGPDGWEEIVHHLTARSVIRDFENMAEKESDMEHGEHFIMMQILVGWYSLGILGTVVSQQKFRFEKKLRLLIINVKKSTRQEKSIIRAHS